RRMRREEGVRLERELVERQVRRLESERGGKIVGAAGERLARQGVHQIDVERLERKARFLDRGARFGAVVNTPERPKHRVVEALHADRQAGHAGIAEGSKAVALEAARIRLERDLATGLERQAGADRDEETLDLRRREEARRAAADEDSVHAPAP